jgi:hypothetical protein
MAVLGQGFSTCQLPLCMRAHLLYKVQGHQFKASPFASTSPAQEFNVTLRHSQSSDVAQALASA